METTHRKPWSELALLVTLGIALLIAGAATEALDGPAVWTLLAVLAAGYALSRGAARNELRPLRQQRARPVARERGADARTETAAEVVVSEEQLHVDRRRRPAERVRLRKEIVTDEVTITVPVRREVVRLERVPIEPGELGEDAPLALSDGRTQELVLMEEQAVVDTRVVPRERVWLEKDVVTSEEQFTQTVRREEAELEREPSAGGDPEQEQP